MLNRKYGIEIECVLPAGQSRATVAAAIAAQGVPCYDAGYTHSRSASWKIVSDGSVRGTVPMELVSPPMTGDEGMQQIAVVSRVLLQLGAQVNTSCGLHVHVDAAGMSSAAMRKLAAIYIENENIIDSFMPVSRRGSSNHYCGSLRQTNMSALSVARNASEIAQAISRGNRFVKLNYTAFLRHGTVEFRHHSGTVDAEKINKWLLACLRLVACAVKEEALPFALTQTANDARPRGSSRRSRRLQTIYDLMQRPGGCTRADVATVLGRRTAPPMNRILRGAGFNYRVEHSYGDRRTERYVLSATPVAINAPAPITFDGFCSRIEMPEAEKSFWINRRIAVNSSRLSAAA